MVLCPTGKEKGALLIMYIYIYIHYCYICIQQSDTVKTAVVPYEVLSYMME